MSSLCLLLGYTRQAFYGYKNYQSKEALQAELLVQEVLKHRELHPRIGTRKLVVLLQCFGKQHGISLGRDALFDLLRDHGLLIRRRKRKVQTTFSNHWLRKYPNHIRGFVPLAANLLWVSDITYIAIADEFAYLSLVTDAYSRKIVGFYLSGTLEAAGCIKALKMAMGSTKTFAGLIHHSDRGVQYCSHEYVKLLEQKSIKISMTENGDPLENAIAERVNGILKEEYLQQKYQCFEDAQKSIAKTVAIYNSLRPHSSCEMKTPAEAHEIKGPLKRKWKNYYKKKELTVAP